MLCRSKAALFLGKDYHSGGSEMSDTRDNFILEAFKQLQINSELVAKRLDLLQEHLSLLSVRIADLENEVEEIPNLGKILAAVQELQEQHDAPASVFTHYISGGVPR